jgi:hypothetical protein
VKQAEEQGWYRGSDHFLDIASNLQASQHVEHLELRRQDVVELDALRAERIPGPTTAGDFCRRYSESDGLTLMDTTYEARLRFWTRQPPKFFAERVLEADGTIVPSDPECK